MWKTSDPKELKTKEKKRDKGFDVLGVSQKKNGRLKKEFLLKR